MKRFLSLLALVGFSTCILSAAKADPPDSKSHGTVTLTVNARLIDGAPQPLYYITLPNTSVTVTVSSTHYAEYIDDIFPTVNLTLTWYFRNGVFQEATDPGTDIVTLPAR